MKKAIERVIVALELEKVDPPEDDYDKGANYALKVAIKKLKGVLIDEIGRPRKASPRRKNDAAEQVRKQTGATLS